MRTGILIVVVAFLVICLMAILCREINKLVIKNERLMQHNQQLNDAVVNKAEQYAKLAELHNRLISEKNELVTRLAEAEASWADVVKERDEIKQKYDSDAAIYTGIRYKLSDLTAENDRLKKLLNKKKWL